MADVPQDVPVSVRIEAVVAELVTDPHGRALWERAQFKVANDVLMTRIRDLEGQRGAAATPPPRGDDDDPPRLGVPVPA